MANDFDIMIDGGTAVADTNAVTGYVTPTAGGTTVTSFNTRTGAVTLLSSDVTGALTYTPVNIAGDTMTGKLTLAGSTTSFAPINLGAPGVAPTTPVDGDVWIDNSANKIGFKTATGSFQTATLTGTNTFTNATLVFGNATATSTTGVATGATISGATKTVNIGTGGVSGSTSTISIGSNVSGATSTIALNGVVTLNNALAVASGGTGATSTTVGGVVYGSSSTALATTSVGTSGYLLASGGAGAPTWVENSLISFPGSSFKKSVRVATTTNITLSGTQTIDGVAVVAGDRVLVKNQTTASANGIYVVSATAWARTIDGDTAGKIASAVVAVDEGTTNGGELWTTNFKTTDTLGTTAMNWFEVVYNSGTWAINASTATTLQTARTINGTSFDGSANITVTANTPNSLTAGSGLSGTAFNGSAALTWTLATAYGDTINPYASKTANFFLAAPNGAAGVPTFRAIVAADIPTLNQNTTGSSGSCTGNAATATTATTATNWGTYGAVPAAGTSFGNANTIGRSDASGYTYFSYINSNTGNAENPTVSQVIVTNGTDNFYRKASIGHLTSNLSGTAPINISGTATTATTANALNTGNNYQVNSLGVGTAGSAVAGEIRATNNITAFYVSDIRFKENVQPIVGALDIVSAVGGKTFDWTDAYIADHGGEDGYFVRKQDFGFIAQDVQRAFALATRQRPDGSLAVDYEKLVAVAFQAIADLRAEVEALKNDAK